MPTPAGNPRYRLRIHDGDPATLSDFEAGIGGNILSVTSLKRDSDTSLTSGPYLAGDGPDVAAAELDLLKNTTLIGTGTVRVIDARAGGTPVLVAAQYFDGLHSTAPEPPSTGPGGVWLEDQTPFNGTGGGEDGSDELGLAFSLSFGAAPGSYTGMCQRTFTPTDYPLLQPSTTYTIRVRAHTPGGTGIMVGRFGMEVNGVDGTLAYNFPSGGTIGYTTYQCVAVSDVSGHLVIRLGWKNVVVPPSLIVASVAGFDNLEIYEGVYNGPGRVVTRVLADAQARMQLLSRRAVIEECDESDCSVSGGIFTFADPLTAPSYRQLVPGYVNRISLVNALDYEITVGETRREEARIKLGETVTADDGATCRIGGLVRGGFGQWVGGGDLIPDYDADTENRWEVDRVDDTDTYGTDGRRIVVMQFVHGWLRPFWAKVYTQLLQREVDEINQQTRGFYVEDAKTWYITGQSSQHFGWYPALAVDAVPVSAGSPFIAHPITKPIKILNLGSVLSGQGLHGRPDLMVETGGNGLMYLDWPENDILDSAGNVAIAGLGPAPTPGDQYDLVCYPTKVSAQNPIHYRGHPVDIHTALLTRFGIPFDATSAANAKTALGDLFLNLRETEVVTLGDFVEQRLQGPFGYATRIGANAQRVFFPTRVRPTSPAFSITQSDRRNIDTRLWELDEASIINGVDLKTKSWRRWTDGDATPREADDLVITDSPVEGTRVDQSTFSDRRISYEVSGTIHVIDTGGSGLPVPMDLSAFVSEVGGIIIDRFGRGAPYIEIDVFKWVTAEIGDEVTLDVPDLPVPVVGNSPVTQRGAAPYTMTVISKKPVAAGFRLRLVAAGALSQGSPPPKIPVGTPGGVIVDPLFNVTPDFVILGGVRYSTMFVQVINASGLKFLDLDVYFEYATGASAPGVGVSGTEFGPLLDPEPANDSISTPPCLPGESIWVRARTGDGAGHFSSWTAWDGGPTPALTGGIGGGVTATPDLSAKVSSTGVVDVTASVDAKTVIVKMAAGPNDGSASPPSLTTIRAATPTSGPPYIEHGVVTLGLGDLVTIGCLCYDVNGNESQMGTRTVQAPTHVNAGTGISISISGITATISATGGIGGVINLDDLADVNAPSPSDGDVLTWDAGGMQWIAVAPSGGGGGGGSVTEFYPDKPQGSPSALDDDCDGASPPTRTSVYNAQATDSYTAFPGYFAITPSAVVNAPRASMGALPAGDGRYQLHLKMPLPFIVGNLNYYWGVCVADGTTFGSGKQAVFAITYYNNRFETFVFDFNGYTGSPSATPLFGGILAYGMTDAFIRLARNGTTWTFEVSPDGVRFHTIGTVSESGGGSLGFTPTEIGPFVTSNGTMYPPTIVRSIRYNANPATVFGGLVTL